MQKKALVSVIMSVQNGMPYLKEAVRSILKQEYKNFEFIIVDDASNDDSQSYLKSLKDKRLKLIFNKRNLGVATSLNKALKITKGEYIARMDADDISSPERFQVQLRYLKDNPSIDIVGSWANLINEKGETIGEKKYPTSPSAINKTLPFYSCVIHPTFFAKKSLFELLNGYDPKYDYAEDYDFLMRAKNKYKIANINQKLLQWRLWSKRRSRINMIKMDKIDLKIKIASIIRDGASTDNVIPLVKKLILVYTLPFPLKIKIAKLLKTV